MSPKRASTSGEGPTKRSPDPDTPGEPRVLQASVGAFIAAYARHLPLLGLLEQQTRSDPHVRELWKEIRERPVHRHARYIRRLAAEGRAAPVAEPLAVARAVGGMCVEFARLTAAAPGTSEAAVRDVTAMYLHLLGAGPRPPREPRS
ncbi:hypothetical protein [Streptomyces sp. NPDC005907]|uniref:hypothetical protein n=1 Tax=Streptomyces sp. NPDC005907 TaxID=3154571 RepID=UPI0034021A81